LSPAAMQAVAEASAAINGGKKNKNKKDPAAGAMEVGTPGDSALRRALLVGWADRVARRAKANEQAAAAEAEDPDGNGGAAQVEFNFDPQLERAWFQPSSL
jgi:hypothetical protein